MKKFFLFLLLSFSVCFGPAFAENKVMDRSYHFETYKGKRATNARRTTNAAWVHLDGIKGELKSRKKLTAAIIDSSFHPEFTADLKRQGHIHPAVFTEHLVLDPDENLGNMRLDSISQKIADLRWRWYPSGKKTILNDKEIKRLEELQSRKILYDVRDKDQSTHGSGVMDAVHMIAPEAKLLPIDLGLIKGSDHSSRVASAIRKAIQYGADVINISQKLYFNPELTEACKDAARRGAVIITSAGNDSSSWVVAKLHEWWDRIKSAFVKSAKQDLFETLEGKRIRFAGALDYTYRGEEQVASYSTHPGPDTDKHFIFAAGSQLPIRSNKSSTKLDNGTSFSAPVVTGGYLLMKQLNADKGYSFSPDELLDMMYESGRDVEYKHSYWSRSTYKSLDLYKAMQLAQDKADAKKHRQTTYIPKSQWVYEPYYSPKTSYKSPAYSSSMKSPATVKASFARNTTKGVTSFARKASPVKRTQVAVKRTSRKPTVKTTRATYPVKAKGTRSTLLKRKSNQPLRATKRPVTSRKTVARRPIFSRNGSTSRPSVRLASFSKRKTVSPTKARYKSVRNGPSARRVPARTQTNRRNNFSRKRTDLRSSARRAQARPSKQIWNTQGRRNARPTRFKKRSSLRSSVRRGQARPSKQIWNTQGRRNARPTRFKKHSSLRFSARRGQARISNHPRKVQRKPLAKNRRVTSRKRISPRRRTNRAPRTIKFRRR